MEEMRIAEVAQAVLQGIEFAQTTYEAWSGGMWLHEGPEYFATVEIARKLMEFGAESLTMEQSVKAALQEAGVAGPGKLPDAMRPNGKFDIVLWRAVEGGEAPWGILEIKTLGTQQSKIEDDVDRIFAVLDRKPEISPFQFGMLGWFLQVPRDKKPNVVLDDLRNLVQQWFDDWAGTDSNEYKLTFTHGGIHAHPDYGDWAAVCVTLSRAF